MKSKVIEMVVAELEKQGEKNGFESTETWGYKFKIPCKNSLNGKHKWIDKVGKNSEKPQKCTLCDQLFEDLINREKRRKSEHAIAN